MQTQQTQLLDQRQRFAAAAMQRSSDDSKQRQQPSRYRAELDARARVMRAAPASAGASAALASSPITSSSHRSTHRASSVHEAPRSTRALLSRLFRSSSLSAKTKRSSNSPRFSDTADGSSDSERLQSLAPAMDAMHMRNEQQQQAADDDDCDALEHFYHHHSHYYPTPATDALAPATVRVPMRKVLVQGYLTKLPGHKYWHAKVRTHLLSPPIAPSTKLSSHMLDVIATSQRTLSWKSACDRQRRSP